MSGTSLDGIDIVLCNINKSQCKLLYSHEFPFQTQIKEKILSLISEKSSLQTIGELDTQLGLMFADAINSFLDLHKIKRKDIQAIGLHGQTLWHEPNSEFPFSMQLGNANIVCAKTSITTISDFRRMDMAHGGQGAPFTPAFHQFLFSSLGEHTAVVNIGGMANITLLGKTLQGWDTGCGNVLLDLWMQQTQEKAYDKDGLFAQSGTLDTKLLASMLSDSYFTKPAPKSTGREYFNASWLSSFLPLFHTFKDADIQRTLLELTALSIANDLNASKVQQVIICGGGAKNSFLMQRLQALTSAKVILSDALGVSSDFLEAMAFAWFAYKRIHKEKVALSSVTGAKQDSLLGCIYE